MKALFTLGQAFLTSLVFFLIAAMPAHATNKGIEVKSDNFILIGDLYTSEAEDLITDLEIFRTAMFKILKLEPKKENPPVRIYAIKDTNKFQEIVQDPNVAGKYRNSSQGAIFVLDAKGGFDEDGRARRVAMHEFVHHVISAYTNQSFPRWYNEGYANFLANFKIKSKKFIIGSPDRNYAYLLKEGYWMPMDVMIGSVSNYPFQAGSSSSQQKSMQQAFYAQTWLAVTFLQTNPEYARKSGEYLRRVHYGDDSLQAFEETMGMTPDEFGDVLKTFLKKNNFLRYPLPLSKEEKKPNISVRKTTLSEYESAILNAKIHFNQSFGN